MEQSQVHLDRRTLAEAASRTESVPLALEHLRSASWLVAKEVGFRIAQLSRTGRPTRRLCPPDGLHPRPVHAHLRTCFLSLLGLSGDRLLFSDQPLRHTG